mmetsp:Transcript_46366/g.53602  ORF Transcript_46366/g.53602 Transcript_46366/m.53602 type:complete len:270 (-) Transcript_46366:152-961(-)
MRVSTVFALLLVSASAFNAPQFATRAVGKAPAAGTKAVKKVEPKKKFSFGAKKVAVIKEEEEAPSKAAPKKKAFSFGAKKEKVVVAKKAAPAKKVAPKKKPVVKKAAAIKKAVKVVKSKPQKAQKPPPTSKGYPSIAAKAQNFKLGKGKISGGAAGKIIEPVFIHPTVNTAPVPDFDYKEAAKARKSPQQADFVYDDGLTIIERKQMKNLPAFLSGNARPSKVKSDIRTDIVEELYPFGLSADRFQLLFITFFSLFTLIGALSGSVQLD